MAADYDRALREHAFDLLLVEERLVALIETRLEPDHLWIENVAVAPDEQRKGWGRRLLAHAERKAAAAGRAELRLLTNAAFQRKCQVVSGDRLHHHANGRIPRQYGSVYEQAYRSTFPRLVRIIISGAQIGWRGRERGQARPRTEPAKNCRHQALAQSAERL